MSFVTSTEGFDELKTVLVVGRRHLLNRDVCGVMLPEHLGEPLLTALVGPSHVGDQGRTSTTHFGDPVQKWVLGVLPEACSRHNAPSRAWAIPGIVRAAGAPRSLGIIAILEDVSYANAVAASIASALPMFSAASKQSNRFIVVLLVGPDGSPVDPSSARVVAAATRDAAQWVDMPPDVLHTDRFVAEAKAVAARLNDVAIHIVQGEALREQGLGGLYGVGQASTHPPALVVLDHGPSDAGAPIVLVGKGITYDTGGLSIKAKTGMPGMKTDMGGAAAVLSGFETLVRLHPTLRITAILCIAENAVGNKAIRPDDVLHMLSGRTVEVNNTDAEGRLVLGDGVAWAVKYRQPAVLIDVATLTGAQLVATGRLHAAIMSNNEALEQQAVASGRTSGQLVHPVPFAPELFKREFASSIADMKNSVKDRNNAQVSCAGQFIANHLGNYQGPWLHIDMAGPAVSGGRGTGFGAALLLDLIQNLRPHPDVNEAGTLPA
ncbi:MAG: putative aminopeptidase NPEPL1 [Myxococcota bacterium]